MKLIADTPADQEYLNAISDAGSLSLLQADNGSLLFSPITLLEEITLSTEVSISFEEPAVYNFSVIQNQDLFFELAFNGNDQPLDLAGYDEIILQIKPYLGGDTVANLKIDSGLQILNTNILAVKLSAALSLLWNQSAYLYDLLFIKDGVNAYYLKGKINLINSISRAN